MILEFKNPEIPKIDFLTDLRGSSLYQEWLNDGHEGTMSDFLNWLANSTGGLPSVIASSLSSFDNISVAGEYTIEGINNGFYIGTYQSSILKQMVIWNNYIYYREINYGISPVTKPSFKMFGSELFQPKITTSVTIQYKQDNEPLNVAINSLWYSDITNTLKIYTSTGWIIISLFKNYIYKFENKFYLWIESGMILISDPGIIIKKGTPYSIGQYVDYLGGVVGYILQPTDEGYDPKVQKGIIVEAGTNFEAISWYDVDVSKLPTETQLIQLTTTKYIVGNWYPNNYWSSTESDELNAVSVSFDDDTSSIDIKDTPLFARYAWTFENAITEVEQEDIAVFGKNGNEIKSSGRKLSQFATKEDLELLSVSGMLSDFMLAAIYAEEPGKVKSAVNADTVGGINPDEFARLDSNGRLLQNVSSEKIVGIISSANLPGYVDSVLNINYWQDTEPTENLSEQEYWFDSLNLLLYKYENSVWVEDILSQSVIYNDISIANESHAYRWSGTSMVSTENPLSFASQAEAEAGTGTTQAMNPLTVKKSFDYNVVNGQNLGFETTDKTIEGAINELNDKAINDASDVPYSNINYPTVAAALDKLLYVLPVINSFTSTVTSVEKGVTVSSLTLNWILNKTMTSQTINQGVGSIPVGTLTKALTGLSLTSNITFSLTVSDGINTNVRSVSVGFYSKRYWGVSNMESLNDAAILLVLSNEFSTTRVQSKTLDATGGKYLYFAMPSSFGCTTSKFKIGGLFNSDWVLVTRAFINASGYSESYDIFRSTNLQTGSAISVDII